MQTQIDEFFRQYAVHFRNGLNGTLDWRELAAQYAEAMIAAGPQGVVAAHNDADWQTRLAQSFAYYRQIGTRDMVLRYTEGTPIDADHCITKVGWRGIYAREDADEIHIDFEVHYLLQIRADQMRIFGWISGDETAALRAHGLA